MLFALLRLLLLHFRDPVRDSQSFQDFRGHLLHSEWLMTSVAILSNRLSACHGVQAIVATKTPWKVCMTEIVWVSAPSYLQLRKNIPVIDRENCLTRLADVL